MYFTFGCNINHRFSFLFVSHTAGFAAVLFPGVFGRMRWHGNVHFPHHSWDQEQNLSPNTRSIWIQQETQRSLSRWAVVNVHLNKILLCCQYFLHKCVLFWRWLYYLLSTGWYSMSPEQRTSDWWSWRVNGSRPQFYLGTLIFSFAYS